ncbi:M48 family metallopeptidase [Terasakiella sp. A23]|uniref:M48 family metallopeptidase n=1 Tax=Terasakiella sp. FCG-A23 TaxID=3080561 RepID=UPI002953DE45|nr:M48 family metallopeptidase [Terasakiella sp. A23]MDV7338970.1 M48 family metallopeptidase [Terasakiella sp. A23]
MGYPASFVDGQSARRYDVRLSFSGRLLVISDLQGECLGAWETTHIAPIDRVDPRQPLILSSSKHAGARLQITDESTRSWIYNIIPGLVSRNTYKKESRLAWWLTAATVASAAGIYFLLPVAAQIALALVSVEWERDMFKGAGVQFAGQLGADKLCTYPKSVDILDDMVVRIVGPEKAKQMTVRVVDHKMVNAFATPGQEIILMRGLIEKADSPGEVMGVLAHELGHVDHRHPMQAALRGAGLTFLLAALSGGSMMDLAGLLAETSYSRDHEREADAYALEALKREGVSTQGMVKFFKKLDHENHGLETALQFISTHPMSEDRAAFLDAQKGGGPALFDQDWADLKNICSKTDQI